MPESPNKLLNNDHGNYVYATYTGHIFDTTLDIYFAEARFYDASIRTWLAMDPIKDGNNWYQYCNSNPLRYWDPTGLKFFDLYACSASSLGIADFFTGIGDAIQSFGNSITDTIIKKIQELVLNISGTDITDKEAMLLMQYPYQGLMVFQSGKIADEWTDKIFSEYYQQTDYMPSPHWQDGDAANAYRHAMWNAILAKKIGVNNAKIWTDAHEAWPDEILNMEHAGGFTRGEHTEMDFHNNAEGRSVIKWYDFITSEEEISNRIIKKLKEGELVYIIDDGWYDEFLEN